MAPLPRALALFACVLSSSSLAAEELPSRALARIGDHRFYHGPGIECAVLSPDGKCVASAASYPSYLQRLPAAERAAYDRRIVLWDASTGEPLRELEVPRGPVRFLAFTPDGKRLAAACDLTDQQTGIVLFDVATGKPVRQFADFTGTVRRCHFSADGKELWVSEGDEAVSSWDVATGKRLRCWQPTVADDANWLKPRERLLDGVPSPNGKLIAWRTWEAPDYSKLPPGALPPPPTMKPTILIVCDGATEKPLYRLTFPEDELRTFAFAADGRRFATGGDKVNVRDSATGKKLLSLDANAYDFALSPDGNCVVTANGRSRISLVELNAKQRQRELFSGQTYIASDTLKSAQAFAADGKTLVLATNWTVRLFDVTAGKERQLGEHRTPIVPRFAADGRTLFTTCDEARCRWDVTKAQAPTLLGREVRKVWEGVSGRQNFNRSDDGRLFLDSADGRVRVRETATGRVVRELEGDDRSALWGRFAPDARRLLLQRFFMNTGKADRWQLYDTGTGKRLSEFEIVDAIDSPAFSPDGGLVAWPDRHNVVHLHDAVTGKLVRTLEPSRPLPKAECEEGSFLFSPDGEYVAVTTYAGHFLWRPDGEKSHTQPTCIYRVADGREVRRFYCNPEKEEDAGRLSCAIWSPDGRLLAVAEEESGTIRLLEIATGRVRIEFVGHRHGVLGLAFAPDGQTLASGGLDNVVFLWDVTGARTEKAMKPAGAKELASCWDDLAAGDAKRAAVAAASLLHSPDESLAFFKEHLHPVAAVDAKQLARLIAGLDADEFAQRETASRELAQLGVPAAAALRQALKDGPTPEVKRRLVVLMGKLESSELAPEALRELRSVEVLEQLRTPAARRLLQSLAKGEADARLTRAAKKSLERIDR